jgi:hypothetical protein
MNMQQAMAHLEHQFPEFESRRVKSAPVCGKSRAPMFEVYDFACFVTKQLGQGHHQRVQIAFDGMEQLLKAGETDVRDWVCGFVEAVQDVAGWKESGDEAFVRFLGPETRRAWTTLDAIRTDLADCSILETEVTMWRAVHHQTRGACASR